MLLNFKQVRLCRACFFYCVAKNINSLFHIEEKSDNILRYEKIAAGHTNM
jgi:hypothetical protein